ncbi:glycosyltransferase family protein [Actinopolymorpha cephalotaxi]|uniref:Glycosyltransferase involved in cell wall biosynthesis n=1 Tax=Actinopolymorpha cephalotaxi TaxID=504797 RepID=A0ABX2S9F3_9ACTN|nr:glycosyltransferase family 4 protein [Actinopolymorpha cephalotaxi]NYH86275.1 glycosyltransferase involved in cell wall biosynthesis [Actinopolymorpha cephalotaxi]
MADDTPLGVQQARPAPGEGPEGSPAAAAVGSVVVLCDPNWPAEPGVCCWRANVHTAFTELGLDVHQVAWSPPPPDVVEPTTAPAARMPGTAGVAVRFVGRAARAGAYAVARRTHTAARRVGHEFGVHVARRRAGMAAPVEPVPTRTSGAPDPQLAALAGARLVLAESAAAALAAVDSGVPGAVVWLFAVPPERAAPGEPVTWAGKVREAAPLVGGLVADSLDAAGVLERVAGPVRTIVFPPLAADRPCPTCGGRGGQGGRGGLGARGGTRRGGRTDVHPEDVPGHLALWRRLLDETADGAAPGPTAYSYPVARLRGDGGPWTPPELDRWGGEPWPRTGEPQAEWTAAAQDDGARRLLALLPPLAEPEPSAGPAGSVATAGSAGGTVRVRVFGHDMKFMRGLATRLGQRPDLEVAVDEWRTPGARNDGITENLARSGQLLVAEWARPNAVWLSRTKRPDQRLVVRLHRFEIESDYPAKIELDAVDAVVYIAPHMRRRIRTELGWPDEKLLYIPNYVDLAALDRPKYAEARFTLGMVGITPGLKRFDLALDLLAALRRKDPRFHLLVRSRMGWAHKPSWERPKERRDTQRSLERVEKDPLLRGAVMFDAFGQDMPAWYRKVGHILSLSDVEGSHAALAEGMGSGAVPVIRAWEGAAEAYGQDALCGSLDEAVARVLETSDQATWEERSAWARAEVARRFDPGQVVAAWADLAHDRVDRARARFAAYADVGA